MNKRTLFWGGLILCIVGVLGGIFFLIPGIPHIIADSHMHAKHAVALFALAILGALATIINRPQVRVS